MENSVHILKCDGWAWVISVFFMLIFLLVTDSECFSDLAFLWISIKEIVQLFGKQIYYLPIKMAELQS